MPHHFRQILEFPPVEVSAPCRIDMGGTLDINTFHFPLRCLEPCTVNIAIELRTRVRLFPYRAGIVKVSSKGFDSEEYPLQEAPFNQPLGLMFAIAAYFRAEGVHIEIESSSPPRSALGGSSAAAVALVAAFSKVLEKTENIPPLSRPKIAMLAHRLEGSVAGVPCGLQDQLAAVYGGVHSWYWQDGLGESSFRKETLVRKSSYRKLEEHLLLAYCGIPHESKNINGRWVRQFVSGRNRELWAEIAGCTKSFAGALKAGNFKDARGFMNRELAIRREMTPDVIDEIGEKLVDAALENNCGARFAGAGGGGCIWAMGEAKDISRLRGVWIKVLAGRKEACLLDVKIDRKGLRIS
jgi:D-glycero-alpha-D-manno-heptose-7-phosphate kinase